MSNVNIKGLLAFAVALITTLAACSPQATATATSTTTITTTTIPPASTTTAVTYTVPDLEYRLFAQFDVFWCDPDFYPVARPGSELGYAIAQFPTIQANKDEFNAILKYLSLDHKTSYSDDEKLLIYRQHKKLTYGAQITPSGNIYSFSLRVGEGQGWRYEGTITSAGDITITSKVVSFNTCPICLTKGTMIDTPSGPVPVEQLRQGMPVWTIDSAGNRVAMPIILTAATPVPSSFMVVKIILEDGRTVSASPGHPSAAEKAIGDYKVGDILDGSLVVATGLVTYSEGSTYDILPDGGTGLYWANGILLLSTVA
jgi:hypothetical protein